MRRGLGSPLQESAKSTDSPGGIFDRVRMNRTLGRGIGTAGRWLKTVASSGGSGVQEVEMDKSRDSLSSRRRSDQREIERLGASEQVARAQRFT